VDDRDDEVTRLGHTFNALLRRIDEANTRERQFLADASHELRSPLALMRTELEVAALETQDESGQAATYASLRHQVERLIGVSNALLDLEEMRATTDGDHPAAAAERVDLSVLVENIARRFEPDVQAAARQLATSVPPGLALAGNERWLELAVSNLVTNALRHGAGTINLDVDQDPVRESVGITVTDDGPGFPPEFVHHAFDRFTRADTSRTTRGTGLGLALVQAVAEAHGGNASIDGASVTLRLPFRHDPPTGSSDEQLGPLVRRPMPDRHRAKGIA
jgi:signal transduction histidine kinase